MNYIYKTLTIKELIGLIDNQNLDLTPSYQRGFIWSPIDQKELIYTIFENFPIPNFFIRIHQNGKFEMVDGQQRSRTIYKFHKKEIKLSNAEIEKYNNLDLFYNYEIPVVFIENISDENIRRVYYLINKKGKNLNLPEVHRAQYHETLFLQLVEKVSNYQNFIELDIFSDNSKNRLNDRDFVQELLGYLVMYKRDKKQEVNFGFEGIREKKDFIEKDILTNDIDEIESDGLFKNFTDIIDKITSLNTYYNISETRYRQRNDFYTLFNFINKHNNLNNDLLLEQYKVLIQLSKDTLEGNQLINPNNEDCESLRNYAINCVTQSNSKKAREQRLIFFEEILLNKYSIDDIENNPTILDILTYLSKQFDKDKIELIKVNEFYLLNVELLK